ncbi:hypothetical protein JCM11491_000952 [Sporobolomyces phaffii]
MIEEQLSSAKAERENQSPPSRDEPHYDLTLASNEPSFDLLVLGCGGGPLETNLSCFLVKAKRSAWTRGCAALEGGSTIGAIASLVERAPHSFKGFGLGIGVDEHEEKDFVGPGREGGGKCAAKVWDLIKSFAITHAHLDHISSLVMSSAAVRATLKDVYGLSSTIKNIESVMDFGVWPNLGTRDPRGPTRGKAYIWREIEPNSPTLKAVHPLCESLTMSAFQISHGTDPSNSDANKLESYVSTAFFVRNEETGSEFLFFGDVEPDSISCDPKTRFVWETAAPKIVDRRLSVIFIESSYPASQPADKLFGHLSPPFVMEELQVLAQCVQAERERRNLPKTSPPLEGIHVVIQHIKDDIFSPEEPSISAPASKRPLDLKLYASEAASSDKVPSPLSPLSMSPPIATTPLRRPSIQLSHFSFPSSPVSGPSNPAVYRRASLHPPTSTRLSASPSRKSSTSSSLAPVDEDRLSVRRNSTPRGFRFGSTPPTTSPSGLPGVSPALGQGLGSETDGAEADPADMDLVEETVHERIDRELNELEADAGTGVQFILARQGMRLVF